MVGVTPVTLRLSWESALTSLLAAAAAAAARERRKSRSEFVRRTPRSSGDGADDDDCADAVCGDDVFCISASKLLVDCDVRSPCDSRKNRCDTMRPSDRGEYNVDAPSSPSPHDVISPIVSRRSRAIDARLPAVGKVL